MQAFLRGISAMLLGKLSVFLGLTLASVLALFTPSEPQSGVPPQSVPVGWYIYPETSLQELDESTLRCFNYSRNEWQVTGDESDVKIDKLARPEVNAPPIALPPLLKLEKGMPGRTVRAGLRSAIHFENDWLLAYDAGEWGGGLWITSDDGRETKRILSDNVRGVIPIGEGLLVFSGLAHMSIDFGNVFIFSKPDGLAISLEHAVHLDGEPSAYAKEADDSVLFTTTYGVCRIRKSGELERLAYFPKWVRQQYPNSMFVGSDGRVFVGMRMFVLMLQPNSGKYSEAWLLPNECRKFALSGLTCACAP